ncbi:uncharacterized mitochondrial protein AtMg00810-like [Coccinella septempunctata]|uniref:uncharacterized mitochondrial protein AtMg00810-like n=1 Tax=Coccinella septempunctata TaxID=41139 RepID=UPI001D09343D|nr:uncharacterized mitochondrial protein AtMg00810-like [Coccinella septempunctata]
MEEAKIAKTSLVVDTDDESEFNKNFSYRELIGTLLYLSNKTLPDISYAVGYGSRKMGKPTNMDVTNMKRVIRYLKGTKARGIEFHGNCEENEISAFSDSDFAADSETRKSTTGYVIIFCGGPIAWSSRGQPIMSLSSTEAEYIAAAECVCVCVYT